MPEVHEYPAEILVVFLYPVIKRLYLRLRQETEHMLFQLPASLPRDDLNQRNPLFHRFSHDPIELRLDRPALIKNIVEI